METSHSINITTREYFFGMCVLVCVVIVCVLSYNVVTRKHSVGITAVQFNQIESSCSKNGGIHSVIFFRTAMSLRATIRCKDGASFEHNFQGSNNQSIIKSHN
jgi:hypothetical protein